MNWKTKAGIQRWLDKIPQGKSIYKLGQTKLGGFKSYRVNSRLAQAQELLQAIYTSGNDVVDKHGVEIGTGWVPVIPLIFWLYGVDQVATLDIEHLLDYGLTIQAARQLLEWAEGNKKNQLQADRLATLRQYLCNGNASHTLLQDTNITYQAPADAANTNYPNESIDFIFSNTVLEHIDASVVYPILEVSWRILKPNGFIAHLIDMSDHFAHADRSITNINFLQFEDCAFAQYNSSFLYQNRLRADDWHKALLDTGFEIVHWDTNVCQRSLIAAESMTVASRFKNKSTINLCTVKVVVVARKIKYGNS